ncbi:MAG: hypothetical protein ACRDAO_07935 [Culicoidibacterales bacterium]
MKKVIKWKISTAIVSVIIAITLMNFLLPSITRPQYDRNGEPRYIATNQQEMYEQLYAHPQKNKGKFVTLVGVVTNTPVTDNNAQIFLIDTNIFSYNGDTIVSYSGDMNISYGDYIRITGYVYGTYDFETQQIDAPLKPGMVWVPMITATTLEQTNQQELLEEWPNSVN